MIMNMICIGWICLGCLLSFPMGLSAVEESPKRIGFELSFGVAGINPQDFYLRQGSISTLVGQYAAIYEAAVTESGKCVEDKFLLPFQGLVHYRLNDRWSLKGGLEYGFLSASSRKDFQIALSGGVEDQSFDLDYRVSFLSPLVGAGYRITDHFEINVSAGLAFTNLSHCEDFLSEMSDLMNSKSKWTYEVSGTAPRFSLGGLYRLMLNQTGLSAFVKVEYVVQTVAGLTGTKQVAYGTGTGSELEGTLYQHGWNPYGRGSFDTWDLYDGEPPASALNAEKLRLNLSGLRLMLGLSF